MFGAESKFPGWLDPTSLVAADTNTDFKGGGSTTRTGSLTAVLTARVVEVLPNGDLVLEGVREIDINGDRQIIVLTGVVRTADIGPGNVVPSTAIGQMRIRYFGTRSDQGQPAARAGSSGCSTRCSEAGMQVCSLAFVLSVRRVRAVRCRSARGRADRARALAPRG